MGPDVLVKMLEQAVVVAAGAAGQGVLLQVLRRRKGHGLRAGPPRGHCERHRFAVKQHELGRQGCRLAQPRLHGNERLGRLGAQEQYEQQPHDASYKRKEILDKTKGG